VPAASIAIRSALQGTFRQSQRPAMAFRHAARARAVGRPHHGAALPHAARPSKRFYAANRERPRHCSIEPASCLQIRRWLLIALLSWSPTARRGNRISRRRPPMSASSPACGSTPICSLPAAKAQRPRQATEQRQAFKKALRRLQRSQSLLVAPPRWSLVWPNNRIVEITAASHCGIAVACARTDPLAPGRDPLASFSSGLSGNRS